MALYSLFVLMCRYESAHSVTHSACYTNCKGGNFDT